jgi:hypothetical protein
VVLLVSHDRPHVGRGSQLLDRRDRLGLGVLHAVDGPVDAIGRVPARQVHHPGRRARDPLQRRGRQRCRPADSLLREDVVSHSTVAE